MDDPCKMADFFKLVAVCRQDTDAIRQRTGDVEKAHRALLGAVLPDQQAACSKQIEGLMHQTTALSNSVRRALKDMATTSRALEATVPTGDANLRIRNAQVGRGRARAR